VTHAQAKARATFLTVDLGRQFELRLLFQYFHLFRILFFFHLENSN
jgi:hypothetical protein